MDSSGFDKVFRGLASWFIIIGMALAFALYWIGRLLIYLWNHIEWIE